MGRFHGPDALPHSTGQHCLVSHLSGGRLGSGGPHVPQGVSFDPMCLVRLGPWVPCGTCSFSECLLQCDLTLGRRGQRKAFHPHLEPSLLRPRKVGILRKGRHVDMNTR